MTDNVTLMGVRLDNLSEEEVVGHIVSYAARGEGGRMVNINVDVLRLIVTDPEVRRLMAGAELALAAARQRSQSVAL